MFRIAIISSYPPQRCGIGYYTKDLVETMLKKYNDLEFYIFAEKRSWISWRTKDIGKLHEYRIWDRHSIIYPLQILKEILIKKPDLIFIQHEYGLYGSYGSFQIPLLLCLIKLLRTPVLMTLHTVCPRRQMTKILREVLKYSIKNVILRFFDVYMSIGFLKIFVNKVIIHSNGLAKRMVTDYNYPKQKITVIPHGATIKDKFNLINMRQELGLESKRIILSFGFLSPRKGYDNVIKALPNLIETDPNLVYLIVGTFQSNSGITYLKELKRLVKKMKIEKNVKFVTRQIPEKEVNGIFEMSEIVVLPYLELFGDSGVLRQAASNGKAVIATKVGAIAEVIEDNFNGILVPSNNIIALEDSIKYLIHNREEVERLGKNLLLKANEWDWFKISDNVYSLFKELID